MSADTTLQKTEGHEIEVKGHGGGGSGPVYGIGMIGAWVYFLKGAKEPKEIALAILKGFAWPAFLVYELFMFLKPKQAEATPSDSPVIDS